MGRRPRKESPGQPEREVRVAAGLAQHSNVSINLMDAAPAIRQIFFTGRSRPVLRLHRPCLASSSFNRTRPLASTTPDSTAAWTWGGSYCLLVGTSQLGQR